MPYRIQLDVFEGPFDLLLFLIKKNEVDIYDIPISKITKQFLDYIEVMQVLDLDIAGDFIEMVAILMNIKARMLLPRVSGEDEDEMEDPRLELVERLLEYKKYKVASYDLETLEHDHSLLYSRKYFGYIERDSDVPDEVYLEKVTLFDLIMAFREAMENMPKVFYHEVTRIEVSVEEQTAMLMSSLNAGKIVLFRELMKKLPSKIAVIVTFIAVLELAKRGTITVNQSDVDDDIRIKLKQAA